MTESQKNLISLLAHALFDEPTNVSITPEIATEAQAQAVSSLITTDNKVLAANIRVLHAHAQLTELLHDIPYTTFKGYASAYYYPNPSYRPMGDVDFITAPEYYEETARRLINAGYVEENSEHQRHRGFRKNKIEIELHSGSDRWRFRADQLWLSGHDQRRGCDYFGILCYEGSYQ